MAKIKIPKFVESILSKKGINETIDEGVKTAEEVAKKPKDGDFDIWLKKKYSKQQESLNNMAEKGESELKAVAKRLGMDDEQINKMSADDLMKTVKDKNQDRTMNRITSPNVFDKMEYNKVPQKVLGAGISLGAVHSMMNNGGQQTNSQLYNQE